MGISRAIWACDLFLAAQSSGCICPWGIYIPIYHPAPQATIGNFVRARPHEWIHSNLYYYWQYWGRFCIRVHFAIKQWIPVCLGALPARLFLRGLALLRGSRESFYEIS